QDGTFHESGAEIQLRCRGDRSSRCGNSMKEAPCITHKHVLGYAVVHRVGGSIPVVDMHRKSTRRDFGRSGLEYARYFVEPAICATNPSYIVGVVVIWRGRSIVNRYAISIVQENLG